MIKNNSISRSWVISFREKRCKSVPRFLICYNISFSTVVFITYIAFLALTLHFFIAGASYGSVVSLFPIISHKSWPWRILQRCWSQIFSLFLWPQQNSKMAANFEYRRWQYFWNVEEETREDKVGKITDFTNSNVLRNAANSTACVRDAESCVRLKQRKKRHACVYWENVSDYLSVNTCMYYYFVWVIIFFVCITLIPIFMYKWFYFIY